MSAVAEQLRQGREAQKLTIQQVAESTKIRTDHLRALEEGRYDEFSAPVYIRGFVRTYATLLKLDTPKIMAALDGELAQLKKFRVPPPLGEHSRGVVEFLAYVFSRLNRRKGRLGLGAGIALVLVLATYLVWRYSGTRDPLADLPPGIYRGAKQTSGETLPLPPATPRRP